MQYELAHTSGGHSEPADAAAHGLDHGASQPDMARAMARDMRNHFFVALALTIPVFLLSPLAVQFFSLELIGSRTGTSVLE